MATRNLATFLNHMLGPVVIQVNGADSEPRATINFTGNVTLTDDGETLTIALNSTLASPTIETPTITGTVTHQGTKYRELTIVGEVQTTTATTAVIAQHTILDGTSTTFDFIAGMKAVGTTAKAGRWDGKVTYQRNSAGAPSIVGAAEYGPPQETTAGDGVTFDLSGNVLRVLATAADADDRNWTCALRVHETLDDA
jgi:hypothetical protein